MRSLAVVLALAAAALGARAQEAPATAKKVSDHVRSLVLVEVLLSQREDLHRSQEQLDLLSYEERERERLRKLGTPLVFPGVVVGKGEILFSDPRLAQEDYGTVTVRTWDGVKRPARLAGLLRHAPGVLVVIEAEDDSPPPIRFSKASETAFASFRGAWLERSLDRIVLRSRTVEIDGLAADGDLLRESPFPPGALLLDARGSPVGVALGEYLFAETRGEEGRSTFLGPGLLRTPGILREGLSAAHDRIRTRLGRAFVRVRIEYHLPGRDEGGGFSTGSSGSALPDDEGYALLFAEGRVFLPLDPGLVKIRSISRVVALVGEGATVKEIEGGFVGSMKEYEGLLLEFPGIPGAEPVGVVEREPPRRFEHCVIATPERRFGRDRVKLRSARVLGEAVVEERGKERRRPVLDLEPSLGALLLDLEGGVLGIVTREKAPGEEGGGLSGYYESSPAPDEPLRVFWSGRLAKEWSAPEEHLDPRAVPRTRLGARRLVWLGVEFQYISPALAREVEVQDATRDGERGILVNLVYPGSPAEKVGMRRGDVLLYLLETGKSDSEKREFLRPSYFEWRTELSSYGGMRFASRSNELTRMLTAIGEGAKVRLAWQRDAEERSVEITLEEAPADFESAEKEKDERLGLTVKDLTYEVRAFYRLPDDYEGVIVARVESGSPAEVAEVEPLAILHSVNGKMIPDVAVYREIIAKALEEEGRTLTFFMKVLAGGRFVEVRPEKE